MNIQKKIEEALKYHKKGVSYVSGLVMVTGLESLGHTTWKPFFF